MAEIRGHNPRGVLFAFGRPNPRGYGADRHAIGLYRALSSLTDTEFTPVWQAYGWNARGSATPADITIRHCPLPERVCARPWRLPDAVAGRLHRGFAIYHHAGISTDPPVDSERLVVSFHDLVGARFPETPQAIPNWAPRLLGRARLVLTLSEFSKSEIAAEFHAVSDRIRVVGSGCDIELFRAGRTLAPEHARRIGDRPFVVLVGGTTPRKNAPRALEAAARVAMSQPDLVVVVAGGRIDTTVSPSATALVEHGRLIDAGYVTDLELAGMYAHAAALVYPSLYEGFGLPILEAFAAGCPVVTSRDGATGEVAGGLAALADPTDADSIAEAIETAVAQGRGGDAHAALLRARATEFSWERCALRHVAAYREVLGAT